MTYPDDLTLVTFTTAIVAAGGRPLAGNSVTAVPVGAMLTNDGAVLPYRDATTTDAAGRYTFSLPAVDDPKILSGVTAYLVTEHAPGGRTFHVAPLMSDGPGPVDVSAILVEKPQKGELVLRTGPVTDETMSDVIDDPASATRASLLVTIDSAATPVAQAAGREAAVDILAQQPEVTQEAATRAVSVAADPAIAGRLTVPTSQTTMAAGAAFGTYFPESYGAVGDGATNDTAAIQAAIDAARDAGGGTVQLRSDATYVVTTLDVQAGLTIMGYGSTFLRPAMMPNWTRTITNQNRKYVGDVDSPRPIIIRGLTVDGNLANQGPYTGYEQEQSALIFMAGDTTKAGRERVIFQDVTTIGSVADGIHVTANIDATITGCRGTDCFRGGITYTGGNSIVHVSDYRGGGTICGAHFDMEIDTPGFGGSRRADLSMRDATFNPESIGSSLQITGSYAPEGARINLDRVSAGAGLNLYSSNNLHGHAVIRAADCEFHTAAAKNTVVNPYDVRFDRTTFTVHNRTGAPAATSAVRVTYNNLARGINGSRLRFTDCTWHLGTVAAGDTSDAIFVDPDVPALDNRTIINGGTVSTGYSRAFVLTMGGHLAVDRAPAIHAQTFIHATMSSTGSRFYHLDVGTIDPRSTFTTYTNLVNSHAECTVRHTGTVLDDALNAVATTSGLATNTYLGARTVMVAAAPTSSTVGFRGDRAVVKVPVAGQPYEWVCTATRTPTSTWKALTSAAA